MLLVTAILFAAGALFAKYRLELLRAAVQVKANAYAGMQLRVDAVVVNGLRGLRIEGLDAVFGTDQGPTLRLRADVALIDIDVVDLLEGTAGIDRIQLEQAIFVLSRPADREWFVSDDTVSLDTAGVLPTGPFRVTGADAVLKVQNVVGDTQLQFDQFQFDVSRLPDATDVSAKFTANLDNDPGKGMQVDLRYASMDDFDLRVQCAQVTSDDVNVFLPASRQLIETGELAPRIRVTGYPNKTLVLSCEASFQDLSIRDQPEFTEPATGTITALANYNIAAQHLAITMAKIESFQLGGRLDGSISFARVPPAFNIQMHVDEAAVLASIFDSAVQERIAPYASAHLEIQEPYTMDIALTGTSELLSIGTNIDIAGGGIVFDPVGEKRGTAPLGRVDLGPIQVVWESGSGQFSGGANLVGGSLEHGPSGLHAEKITGVLRLADGALTCEPLNVLIADNPFVGRLQYDLAKQRAELVFDGALSDIEQYPFATRYKDLLMSGSVSVHGQAVREDGKYVFDGEFDATQADLAYQWWLRKPAGIGATGNKVHAEIMSGHTWSVAGEAVVASTPISFRVAADGIEQVQTVDLTSEQVDIAALGKCFVMPYTLGGGTGTNGHFTLKRSGKQVKRIEVAVSGHVDQADMMPDGGKTPIHAEDIQVAVEMDTEGERRTGYFGITAQAGRMPPFGEIWFLPLISDPVIREKYPYRGRQWRHHLAVASLEVLPWKGTSFVGESFNGPHTSGFERFEADIEGGGHIKGQYQKHKADNVYELDTEWADIPAHYLINHLKYPDVLTGTSTGRVKYSVDRDDPGTLRGDGQFEVHDGQFSADFLLARFEKELESDPTALPPSLKFSTLSMGIAFRQDTVKTPRLHLVSEGISIKGNGQFVHDGDMDYELAVSISPAAAAKMSVLRDAFNVKGLQIAQQDIELTFHVTGPTFNPRGELADLPPVGVTLVSGALEVTSEALKVIDLPRRILVDLLKTGSGVVGVRR